MTPYGATPQRLTPLERGRVATDRLALGHVAVMILLASWAYGGNARWVQTLLLYGGLAGSVITVLELVLRARGAQRPPSCLRWLLPLLLFNAFVVVSTWFPAMEAIRVEGDTVLRPRAIALHVPSTAVPATTWRELLLYNALFLPGFNLLLTVRRRSLLRFLLIAFAINGVALAVYGTLQKLSQAPGLYFGSVASPNRTFFSTFIYHNHWGAFALLVMCVWIGLIFDFAARKGYRDFFHSPAFAGVLAVVVLLITLPLSSSRSCTLLGVVVVLTAAIHAFLQARRASTQNRRARIGFIMAFIVAGLGASYWLAEPVIRQRSRDTHLQLDHMRSSGSVGARAQLYGDTLRMAADRPVFGWGLGTYGVVFSRYNTQESTDRLPQHYEDAHSDWLQSAAEVGLLGTVCRLSSVALPLLLIVRLRRHLTPLTIYPLLGCGLLCLYAWIEFPFGNAAIVLCAWTLLFVVTRSLMLSEERSVA